SLTPRRFMIVARNGRIATGTGHDHEIRGWRGHKTGPLSAVMGVRAPETAGKAPATRFASPHWQPKGLRRPTLAVRGASLLPKITPAPAVTRSQLSGSRTTARKPGLPPAWPGTAASPSDTEPPWA